MTPTNEQIFAEAIRRQKERGGGAVTDFIIEVVREGWTPPEPEPEPVDPDVLAFREWFADRLHTNDRTSVITGRWDANSHARAYLAGARMAREQERERAGPLVRYIEDLGYAEHRAALLAKYLGEA